VDDVSAAQAQALALLSVVREALGVDRFALVGTCYGSRVALSLVEQPGCVGAVCLAPPILGFGGLGGISRRPLERRLPGFLRSSAALRRAARALRRRLPASKPLPGATDAFGHLARVPLVFLYGERSPAEDHYSPAARAAVDAGVAARPPAERARFELRLLPGGPLTTFDGLPPAEQHELLATVVPYVTRFFAPAG
jgi:pimeloyl-ACP methyl ester carboxylesterase